MKNTKIIFLTILLSMLLSGCENLNTINPYTGQTQLKKSTKYGIIGAATCAAINSLAKTTKRKTEIVTGCALVGAAYGHYADQQEDKLRRLLANTGVHIYRRGSIIELIMPGDITFAIDSSDINSNFYKTLKSVGLVLKQFNNTQIQVIGYTDTNGSFAHNQVLSEKRANSVSHFLRSQGVAPQRLSSKGMGERNPIASNQTEEGRRQNRRVSIQIKASSPSP